METEKTPFWTRALEVLRQGPFCRYIIGSAISDTGTWMQVMAQAWVMSSLTNKAILLGMVNFAAGLPTLALTMIGGAAADRYDKRMILIATQVVQIALAVLLGWLVLTNRIHIWHVLVVAALLGVSIAFEMPAISALVPELVKRDQIATAVALDRSVFHGSRLVGPFMAGLIVAWWGAASAFFLNAFSFLALIAALISLPARIAGTAEEEEQRRSGIKEGFRYVASDRIMISMIALIALTTIFVFPVISVMLPLYVRNILQLGPDQHGLPHGGLGRRLAFRLARVAQHCARKPIEVHDRQRHRRGGGDVLHVALDQFFADRARDGLPRHRAFDELRPRQHDRAGTRARAFARPHLRRFRPQLFGLMPIGGLLVPGVSDLIGMRTALAVSSIIFGIGAFFILSAAGRHVCDEPVSPATEPEPAAVA